METGPHDMAALFLQLGLPSDAPAIDDFIRGHRALARDLPLSQAPFWSVAQATFLAEATDADADWSAIVDALNVAMHRGH